MMKPWAFCILFLTCVIVAQSQLPSAKATYTVRGQVTDSSGAKVPGVQVRVKDPDIRLARSGVTDDVGKYEVTGLPPGRYLIRIDDWWLAPQSKEVELGTGDNGITVNLVVSPRPYVDTPGVSATLSESDIIESQQRQRQSEAEFLVELLFGWSSQKIWAGESQTPTWRGRQETITKKFRMLGKEGVAALLLGLKDPDAQFRRNAALILLDLAGGFTVEARSRLSMSEALPALTEARSDVDPEVRRLIEEVIREIR